MKGFKKICRQNYIRIYNYIYAMTGEPFLAEDLTQEVFLIAWEKGECFIQHEKPEAFLYRTAKIKVLEALREEKKNRCIEFQEDMAMARNEPFDLFSLGVVSYAAGIFLPQIKNGDGSVTTVNAAQDSDEFKAMQEYNRYLDHLTEAEWRQLADTRAKAVYDFPSEVKEICGKYSLKFATKKTELSSYTDAAMQLKKMGLFPLLGDKLRESLEQTGEGQLSGYVFDDGNFHFEAEIKGEDNGVHSILSINFTPEGSFPWTGFASNMGDFDEKQGVGLIQKGPGICFSYITNSEQDKAKVFGKAGGYYMTLGISKTLTGSLEQGLEQERIRLMGELDQKVCRETGERDYESLFEKFAIGLAKAAEVDNSAVREAEAEHDWELKRKLLLKYGDLTEAELDVYSECEKKLAEQLQKRERLCIVTGNDVEQVLAMFDFESLEKQ